MGKHSDYAGSSASRSTQNFLEGNWEIIFKALLVYREAVYERKHWNALTCPLMRDWLSYGVFMKWNTMRFLKAMFVDEYLLMWKIFMKELK